MRILYVTWLDAATTDYPLFLADAWSCLGHEIRLVPYDLDYSSRLASRLKHALGLNQFHNHIASMTRLVDARCAQFQPHVLLYGGTFIEPEQIDRLRKKHACIIGQIIGYNHLMLGRTAQAIGLYDFLFVHDSYLIPVVQGHTYGKNPNVFWLPFMADPHEHRPLSLSDFDKRRYGGDVAFIGGASKDRIEALSHLTSYDLRIWGGAEWQDSPELAPFYQDEPVYGLKKTKIYNASRIVLNIEVSDKQIDAISNRVPEVLACGGFVMTVWRADLGRSNLRDGDSIVVFRTVNELVEKVEYYLAHPQEREMISQRGREIVLNSLTYDHLAREMAKQMESVLGQKAGRQ